MQKKLILFGGTGFVGANVARKALLRGYSVVVATRSGVPDAGSPLEALAQRAQLVGGRQAALEATKLGAVGLAGGATPPDVSEGSAPGAGAGTQKPASDDVVEFIHSVENERVIDFVSIDASNRAQVFDFLHDHPDATSVVNTVGLLTTDYDDARQINGDVNTNICAGFCHEKLLPRASKLVYVSAEPYGKYLPRTLGSRRMLKGYFHGKSIAEQAVLKNLGQRGVVLRPGFIYGTRFHAVMSPTNEAGAVVPIPLGIIGKPLDVALSAVGGTKLLTPPVDVDIVAEAAVRAIEWAQLPELAFSGVVTVQDMKQICAKEDPTGAGEGAGAAAQKQSAPSSSSSS